MKMLCTSTCQYKGVTRSGTILDIPESELETDIVKHNFKQTDLQPPATLKLSNKPNLPDGDSKGFTVGDEKKNPDPAAGETAGLTNGNPLPPTIIPPKDENPETQQNPDKDNPPLVEPVFADMTVVEIRAWLDANGAIYPDKANKSELVASAKAAYEALNKGK
jgi:hypothetical protein